MGFENLKEVVMKETTALRTLEGLRHPGREPQDAAEWIATASSPRSSTRWYQPATVGVDNVKSTANLMMLTGNMGKPVACLPAPRPEQCPGARQGALRSLLRYQKVPMRRQRDEECGVDEFAEASRLHVTEWSTFLPTNRQLKAMYIMGENPMLSDPDLHHVEEGLRNLEFLVVQDIFMSETAELADVVLPAACYAEKDGTQTNTERRVQRWKKAQDPPGEAKPDWQILCELGKKMGYEKQFAFESPEAVFNEVAAVTPSYHGMSYARLDPDGLHWPCPTEEHPGTPILHRERFAMPDGLGVFSPIEWKPPAEVPDDEYPYVLTTGRTLWQWHTGTMTRRSWSLEKEAPIGWIEINSEDAKELGIEDDEIVRASTRRGSVEIPARVTSEIIRGVMFIPFHYKEHPRTG
jgi:formate dehydrogenase major subunit